jgi:hypothetical protein
MSFSQMPRPALDFKVASSAAVRLGDECRESVAVLRRKKAQSEEALAQRVAEDLTKTKERRKQQNLQSSARRDLPRLRAAIPDPLPTASAPFQVSITGFGPGGNKKVFRSADELLQALRKSQGDLKGSAQYLEEDKTAKEAAEVEKARVETELSGITTDLVSLDTRLGLVEQAVEPLQKQEKQILALWERVDVLDAGKDAGGQGKEEREKLLEQIGELYEQAR